MATAPRKPTDRKPKAAKGQKAGVETPFTFTHDGKEYTIPPGSTLSVGFARRIRHLPEGDQFFEVLEALADEETLAAIDDMHAPEFREFQLAWQRHSQVTPGE